MEWVHVSRVSIGDRIRADYRPCPRPRVLLACGAALVMKPVVGGMEHRNEKAIVVELAERKKC